MNGWTRPLTDLTLTNLRVDSLGGGLTEQTEGLYYVYTLSRASSR
jgi:hypothetical protein